MQDSERYADGAEVGGPGAAPAPRPESGTRLAAGELDGHVSFWDIPQSQRRLASLPEGGLLFCATAMFDRNPPRRDYWVLPVDPAKEARTPPDQHESAP